MDRDQALVQAAQQGDSDAVDTLVRHYQVRMYNFARALTASDLDAEDVAQETFIRAFRGLRRFRGDSSFKNWLYSIAANVARTHRGKRLRQSVVWDQRLEADDVPAQQLATHADVEGEAIRRQVLDRALSTLPEDQRIPLVLHDVEGLEYKEIAAVLAIPIGTVMSRIFRGRQRLRPLLAELRGHVETSDHVPTRDQASATPAGRTRVGKKVAL